MIKDNRFLNIGYETEVIVGRLNGSSKEVENGQQNNVTYVKKINGKGTISAQCQKWNIKKFTNQQGYELSKKIKTGGKGESKVETSGNPYKFIDEDIFGYMATEKGGSTKKRTSRWLMSHLTQVDNRKVTTEFNSCSCENKDGENETMPYKTEIYSGLFAGISNLDINNISNFIIDDKAEFKDYTSKDKVKEEDIQISKEEKFNRIKTVLEGLRYLSIQGNQSNYLTDTTPKIVILGEYTWGNNVFQGILNKDGINIEALIETLEENERFRKSDIYIGISSKVYNENLIGLKDRLKEELQDYDYVKIDTVGKSFDNYLKYLEETL